MRRVVVTGFGTINPTGNNVNDSWNNLKNGYNGISRVNDKIHEDTGIFNAGQIKDFDPADHLDRKLIRTLDRVVQLSMVASREAYAMADLDGVEDRFRIGTNITSGIGGLQTIEECVHVTMDKGFNKLSPQFIPKSLINLVGGNVAIDLNLKVYKELERILKTTSINMSVDKVLGIAKTITTIKINIPISGNTMTKTMLLTPKQKYIVQLFDENIWKYF